MRTFVKNNYKVTEYSPGYRTIHVEESYQDHRTYRLYFPYVIFIEYNNTLRIGLKLEPLDENNIENQQVTLKTNK